ncbi:MAG: BspA family leucine-rich repeat surface protein [Muribaculaceae bacterium]|nr:BspA family leucine-rich repeat surface protein [Muribaculaceae bacterium]
MKKTILFLLVTLLTAATSWAQILQSTYTVKNNGNEFTISRMGGAAETVYYRTVSLSAIAGVHFTEDVGTLDFSEGEYEKKITVTETPGGNIAEQYHFQTGTTRTYRFEVFEKGGFLMASCDRDIDYGTNYQFSTTYLNKSVTDLVYFDNSGNIKSGSNNKYLDVSYSSSNWIKVTDAGYAQGVHTVSTDALYNNNSALRTYLNNRGNKMYATVYFTQKEEKDGYQYIQILADNSTTYDGNDPDGAVNNPSTSIYKACFEMSYTGGYVTDSHYQFFPHRYDFVNKAAEIDAVLSRYSFDYDDSYLYDQKYKSSSYNAPNTGSLCLAPTVNELDIRFDAAGKDADDWYFKDLKVRLALVDATAPTVLDNYKVNGGRHSKGNTIYVSVPFSEIVTVSGTPTLSTNWGTLNYVSGSGSNVLTFSGTIGDDANGSFTVYSYSGTIKDLAGNSLSGTISHSFGTTLDASYTYSIIYSLGLGSLPEGQINPETYTYETPSFKFVNPICTLNDSNSNNYIFCGWLGAELSEPTMEVTLSTHSHGDRFYSATWYNYPRYTFYYETGELTLNWGEYDKDHKWGAVGYGSIKSVTATSDVKFVGNCSEMFKDYSSCINFDLNNVNTSRMTSASRMFEGCTGITSIDLSNWDTDSVTDMTYMFEGCYHLSTSNLSGWHTSNVTNIEFMFGNCTELTSLNVSRWHTGNVTNMYYLFGNCPKLESLDVSGWNTANVINMEYLFGNCQKLTLLDLSSWNTAKVENMRRMFSGCTQLTSLNISNWDTGKVRNMGDMFYGCSSLTSLDLSGWKADSVILMASMFYECKGLRTLNLSGWNTGKLTSMDHMFYNCSNLTTLNLTGFKTDNVIDMRTAFSHCSSLTKLDVSGWNTSNVTSMEAMFSNCSSLDSLDLSDWDTRNVNNMINMFSGCSGLESLSLSGWDTRNVKRIQRTFTDCSKLTSLDLSGWNTANVYDMYKMFSGCSSLITIYAGTGWSTDGIVSYGSYSFPENMFENCTSLVGGMGTTYDPNHIDEDYAHIDGGPSNPGYFTAKYTAQRGDVNGDGSVNIADVTTLIDYLLSGTTPPASADCNQDNSVNIADVTTLIDYLLGGQW